MPPDSLDGKNAQPTITLHAGARTDVGSVRSENQDAFGAFSADANEERLFVVADGMGGHVRGREASQLAVEITEETFFAETGTPPERLKEAVVRANAGVHGLAQQNENGEKTGTTCTALAYAGEALWIAHVGDSRAYRVSEDDVEQLTHDHTWAEVMRRKEVLTAEEAAAHPRRHMLVQALGVKASVHVDLIDLGAPTPQQWFVLCSDGLSEVPPAAIQRIVTTHIPKKASEKLLQAALDRGSRDNVTALVIAVF